MRLSGWLPWRPPSGNSAISPHHLKVPAGPVRLNLAAALSGVAALAFELLLFRRLELVLGRSLDATALILALYMAGLGLGAYAMTRTGWSEICARRPQWAYSGVEILTGLAACALVLALPLLGGRTAALWLAGLALFVPTVAMGMAMPLLCGLGMRRSSDFQHGFAGLYLANTLGAVAGLAGGFFALQNWGLPVTAVFALLANGIAAAMVLSFRMPAHGVLADSREANPAGSARQRETSLIEAPLPQARLLILAGVCGFLLLALEVVWMRALSMHFRATEGLFVVVVALVIAGLSIGASQSRRLDLAVWFHLAVLGNGLACLYLMLWPDTLTLLPTAALLIVPCAASSGAVFCRCMAQLREHAGSSMQTGGQLYLVNTLSAALGALLAVWMLLPLLGLGYSWLLCAALFALAVGLLLPVRWPLLLPGLLLLGGLALNNPAQVWADRSLAQFPGYQRLGDVITAPDATLQLAQRELNQRPVAWRLLSDGYSMSGSEFDSLRYMRLFAQLPLAMLNQPQDALLISYGLGNTAQALLADRRLKQLDVVDTSQASVDLSRLMHAQMQQDDPLDDPRTRLHIDDGRHFLFRSERRWDLITAEPPPPRLAGVVNLYTREYFELIRQRLKSGGLTTHWLPMDQLNEPSSAAIIRAFCAVFPDCSLWAGSHYNWILLGGRSAQAAESSPAIEALFSQAGALRLLREVGIERPAQLAATFLGDAEQLAQWLGAGPMLEDDHPGRLQSAALPADGLQRYFDWMDDVDAQRRFEFSSWAQHLWSPGIREQARADWLWQPLLNGQVSLQGRDFALVVDAALRAGLRMPVLRLAGLSLEELSAVAGAAPQDWPWEHAMMALVNGQWAQARALLQDLPDPRAQALQPWLVCQADSDCTDWARWTQKPAQN